MAPKVFWSWQSDRAGKVGRHFVRQVILHALNKAADEAGLEERPEIDQDVQGMAGMVSIPDTILRKIEEAAVFIADVSPVAKTEAGKHVANPNVLIELGYAKKAIGPERILLIWNGALGGCEPEDLPFDLRHRRAPFRYDLAPDATRADLERAADALIGPLAAAIAASIQTIPKTTTPPVARLPSRPSDPSAWFEAGASLPVNSGRFDGTDQLTFGEGPRSYLRITPAKWAAGNILGVTDNNPDLLPLGDTMGLSWGPTRGGYIFYAIEQRDGKKISVRTATQWFRQTGEVWSVDDPTYEMDEHKGLAAEYVLQCSQRMLRRAEAFYKRYINEGPYDVEAGVTSLDNLHWPAGRYEARRVVALEGAFATRLALPSLDRAERLRFVTQAATDMRSAFGLGPYPVEELQRILNDPVRQ